MTTKFISPDWSGLKVAILANGPTMTQDLANSARDASDRSIVVNRAVRFARTADLFVALDPEHHVDLQFDGQRAVGVESDDIDAQYPGSMYETVELGVGHSIEIRNNLLAAMRIAARSGAAQVDVYGYDGPAYEAQHDFRGLVEGVAQIVAASPSVTWRFAEAGGSPFSLEQSDVATE